MLQALLDTALIRKLNRSGLRVFGWGYVRWRVTKGLAGFKGEFFVSAANFANHVVPAVVPTDAGVAIDQGPGAMACAKSLPGLTVGIERDIEIAAIAIAHLPLAHKVVPAWP